MPDDGGEEIGTGDTPRWVKVLAVIGVLLLVILVVLLVTGRGGGHGPGRHVNGDIRHSSAAP